MTYLNVKSGQSDDAYKAADNQYIAAGKAIKPDKECPKCGRGMIHIPDQDKYDCTGVLDGCFYSEDI